MHEKTIGGLVGAAVNMNLLDTPIRVFREARRKGDRETMERALGYAGDCVEKAGEYEAQAKEGMKEEAQAAREKEKAEREKAIEKRREEREKLEKTAEVKKETAADTDSKKGNVEGTVTAGSAETGAVAGKEAVTYTKTGEVSKVEQNAGLSVSVSV